MNFEYTYTGRLRKELIDRKREIEDLKIEVYNLIGKSDSITTRNKYNELCEKWEGFSDFQKEREDAIKKYFYEGFRKLADKHKNIIYDETKHRKIPKDKGNRLYLRIDKIPQDIRDGKFENVTVFGADVFSHILATEHITKSETDLIIEFYNFSEAPLSYLYENDKTFNKMPSEVKIGCFQDTLKEVYAGLRESLIKNVFNPSYYFMMAEMLEDKDVKEFVNKEYGPEKTNITNITKALQEHFPASDDIFEDGKKMPKAIEKFIDVSEKLDTKDINEKDLEI